MWFLGRDRKGGGGHINCSDNFGRTANGSLAQDEKVDGRLKYASRLEQKRVQLAPVFKTRVLFRQSPFLSFFSLHD